MFVPNHEQQPKLHTISFNFLFFLRAVLLKKIIITKSKYYGNY